jgi:hypothetical protein
MYTSASSLEDVGGLIEERQLMEEREGYPGSLMILGRCDQETLEDVHVSQGPPFKRCFETVGPTYTHGDSKARGRYEDASIWVPGLVDIHGEVDPTAHLGYMIMQEDTRACMGIQETYLVEHGDLCGERSSPLQQHMDLGDYLLSSISHMSDDRGSVIDH